MMEYGFIPFINKVTRPSSNTCIDHVFIKTKARKNVLSIIPQFNITDHYPIILSIKNISKNRNNEPNP
jgi:endonuclease/exonuclease/phosphatase family metal-dependent hydrolase